MWLTIQGRVSYAEIESVLLVLAVELAIWPLLGVNKTFIYLFTPQRARVHLKEGTKVYSAMVRVISGMIWGFEQIQKERNAWVWKDYANQLCHLAWPQPLLFVGFAQGFCQHEKT